MREEEENLTVNGQCRASIASPVASNRIKLFCAMYIIHMCRSIAASSHAAAAAASCRIFKLKR